MRAWRPPALSTDRLVRLGIVMAAVGLLLAALGPVVGFGRAAWHFNAARALALPMRTDPAARARLPELRQELAAGRAALRGARAQVAPLGELPLMRHPAGQTLALLDLGDALLGAGLPMVDLAADVYPISQGGRAELVAALGAQRQRIERAEAELERAVAARGRIDRAALAGPLAPIGQLVDRLDARLPDARRGLAALRLLPALAGADRPITYILLAQNEEEKRATGGFIGSIGVVRVSHGEITGIDMRYSYDFDARGLPPVPPPVPLAELMGFGSWHIRDANWFADYPTSARWIEWFWHRQTGEWPDGVIALDEHAFQAAIGAVGAVELPAFGEAITAANYRERTHYWLYSTMDPNSPDVLRRSSFLRDLGTALASRLLALPPEDLVALAPTFATLLDQKHVLLALDDPEAARLLREQGWDGHVDNDSTDFLMVVDTTVSNTKLAPFVDQSVSYQVDLRADGSARARATVEYHNRYSPEIAPRTYPRQYLGDFWNPATGRMDYQEGRYATYVRLYVPRGLANVEMVGLDGSTSVEEESGRSVLAGHLALEPGQRRAVQFSYDLTGPLVDQSGHYRLTAQKQPGTDATPLALRIGAAPGFALARAGEPAQPVVTLATDLGQDRIVDLRQVTPGQRAAIYSSLTPVEVAAR